MAFLAARLLKTGNLLIANTIQFDEVSNTTTRIANSACFASGPVGFDEVTQPANVPLRILTDGTMQTGNVSGSNGIFDEVTGIT
jgi:hypothetical protein